MGQLKPVDLNTWEHQKANKILQTASQRHKAGNMETVLWKRNNCTSGGFKCTKGGTSQESEFANCFQAFVQGNQQIPGSAQSGVSLSKVDQIKIDWKRLSDSVIHHMKYT